MQDYRYVLEIYKEKSFSKAAKNLYISQPSLSASIRKIEERAGIKIFDRSTSSLNLTDAGEIYVQAAKEIITIEDNMKQQLEGLSSSLTGNLSIAGTAFFSSYIIPHIVNEFKRTYPGIVMEFFESDSLDLYDKAIDRHIDVIVDSGSYNHNYFTSYPLFEEAIVLAVPKNHARISQIPIKPLSAADISNNLHLHPDTRGIDISIFQNDSFILLKKEHDLYQRAISICAERNFTPDAPIHLNQLMTAFHMVLQGVGITFVSDTLVKYSQNVDNIVYYKIDVFHPTLDRRTAFIAHKKTAYVTRAMHNFIDLATELYKDGLPNL